MTNSKCNNMLSHDKRNLTCKSELYFSKKVRLYKSVQNLIDFFSV